MYLERPILFFFSAIGAFNGLFLSTYFGFFLKNRSKTTYFLSALLLVISVRIIKSVFLYFYPQVPELFIQIGLSACALIGPFLYLYVSATVKSKPYKGYTWLVHALPGLLFVIVFMNFFAQWESHKSFSSVFFTNILYTQWGCYVVLSGIAIKGTFQRLLTKREKLTDEEIWLITLIAGIAIVWAAYNFCQYTSYISGAVSFSFIFYLLLLVWFFKRRGRMTFFEEPARYGNKKISEEEAEAIALNLNELFKEKELHKNQHLKLSDVARELNVTPHYLSQYLNDNLGQSFSAVVNAHRINAAEEMMKKNHHFTLEAIGYECGFKSNSAFYAAFKKIKKVTPARYKKDLH